MRKAAASLLPAILAAAVFWPATGFDFINLDDPVYVTDNSMVQGGLASQGVRRAFLTVHAGYWIPVTWMSYMADVQLFGMDAGALHRTNVLLHAANAALLALVLLGMTGALWRSVLAASLFALHPMRVESVAWITERKDVLSAFFFLLALGSYFFATKKWSRARRLLLYGISAVAMMAKPIAVTLPIVLLLLDHWPLERHVREKGDAPSLWPRLVKEKAPLFALSAAFSALTLVAQAGEGSLYSFTQSGTAVRLHSFFTGYFIYLRKTFWPRGLAVEEFSGLAAVPWQTALGGAALAGLCLLAVRLSRRAPWFTSGWLWYAVTLLPVSGLVQTGGQVLADRFTYIPHMGLAVIVVWGGGALAGRYGGLRLAASAAAALLLALGTLSRMELLHWRNSVTLFSHALELSPDNFLARKQLGSVLMNEGRYDEAAQQFLYVVDRSPGDALARVQLGVAHLRQGDRQEAIRLFRDALRWNPKLIDGHYNLAVALEAEGLKEEAAAQYAEGLRHNPDDFQAHVNLALLLQRAGRGGEARRHLLAAVRAQPYASRAFYLLGVLEEEEGHREEAIAAWQRALEVQPVLGELRPEEIGTILLKTGDTDGAALSFGRALDADPENATALYGLGVALFEKGQYEEAKGHFEKAARFSSYDPRAQRYLTRLRALLGAQDESGARRGSGEAHESGTPGDGKSP